MTELQSVVGSSLWDCAEDVETAFWQYWQQYRDSLYRCCIKWMGGKQTDAEDALSLAMLKAWEKVQMYEKIATLSRKRNRTCCWLYGVE